MICCFSIVMKCWMKRCSAAEARGLLKPDTYGKVSKAKSRFTECLIPDGKNFRLSKAYVHKVSVINVVTAPEIEMLIILKENQYGEYKKARLKPSEFCKSVLKYHDVKSYAFVSAYFSEPSDLLAAMKQYKEISRIPKGEWTLLDLVKPGIASETANQNVQHDAEAD